MERSAAYWIQQLQLQPHPEGGYYKEMYRSQEHIPREGLPERFGGARSFATSIYFLLEKGFFSGLHRIKSDEGWHFYTGTPYHLCVIHPDGKLEQVWLGPDAGQGQVFQYVVPAGCWFGGRVEEEGYALMGCTVAPGFDFQDFEMAHRGKLIAEFPEHSQLIRDLTYD